MDLYQEKIKKKTKLDKTKKRLKMGQKYEQSIK